MYVKLLGEHGCHDYLIWLNYSVNFWVSVPFVPEITGADVNHEFCALLSFIVGEGDSISPISVCFVDVSSSLVASALYILRWSHEPCSSPAPDWMISQALRVSTNINFSNSITFYDFFDDLFRTILWPFTPVSYTHLTLPTIYSV